MYFFLRTAAILLTLHLTYLCCRNNKMMCVESEAILKILAAFLLNLELFLNVIELLVSNTELRWILTLDSKNIDNKNMFSLKLQTCGVIYH